MTNDNSQYMQTMINNGSFGYSEPVQQNMYNPYSNIMPIGQTNYNQPDNNYVFRPVQNYNGFQQQPYQMNYGCNNYYQPFQNTSYGYQYNYYGNSMSPAANQKLKEEQDTLLITKAKIANKFFNRERSTEELKAIITPKDQNTMTQEQALENAEFQRMRHLSWLTTQPPQETNAMRTARCIKDMSMNRHKELENVGLCEFLEDYLWKFQREDWIRQNINVNNRKDLSKTYSNTDYNELLNMHRTNNPYINELMDNSRYDNNLDDMEIGLPFALDAEQRRKNILEGKVPTYVSSDVAQKNRSLFLNKIFEQMYKKGEKSNV